MGSIRLLPAVLLVMLCALNTTAPAVNASLRPCDSESIRFDGVCRNDKNCKTICRCEGFTSGECRGIVLPGCHCTKPCP
ncbi:unnamed protein product [Spirodela intermedia]|uniref:Knottins-like domain-containing protein n=1 Tax=Spirodela intermedia TaxID=51605 RepID=A0A7I8KP33_SPIIN|nr:unnamed protein product [Spirodela intermedia]